MGNMLWIYFAQIASQSVYPVKFDIIYTSIAPRFKYQFTPIAAFIFNITVIKFEYKN